MPKPQIFMKITTPQSNKDFKQYFDLRWRILRKPWNQPKGSEQDLEEDNSYHFMVVDNHMVIAVARLQFPQIHSAQLRYMAVDDTYQKKGVGRHIIEHIEQFSRTLEAKEIILNARENALGFYEKLGYINIEKSYLLFDSIQHYKMKKTL